LSSGKEEIQTAVPITAKEDAIPIIHFKDDEMPFATTVGAAEFPI
jgi:hypothetical protein